MKVLLIDQIAQINYKYSYSLANSLARQGVDIELVIDDRQDNEYCTCKCHNAFMTSRKDIGKVKKLYNYISSYLFLYRKMLRDDFDIVHVQWFQFSPVDYLFLSLLKKKGKKIIITVHDILPFNETRYDKYFYKRIYALGDKIIVQTTDNIQRIKELFPEIVNDKLTCIPHGHFLDFAEVHDKDESRVRLKIPKDKTVLLFFGQIKKVKGVGILLEAFGEVLNTRDDIFLVIAGSVWKDSFAKYQHIIDKYHMTDDQIKTSIGYISDEDVGYYFSSADIVVLPYIDVYQSGVVQLAYAYNKPVIATDIPGLNTAVQEGQSGYLCESESVISLSTTLIRAVSDKSRWALLGSQGACIVREEYSWERITNNIVNVYRELLAIDYCQKGKKEGTNE